MAFRNAEVIDVPKFLAGEIVSHKELTSGDDCFSPEQLITVEQWAVMLCRVYGAETIGDSWQDVGRSSVVEAYRQGWLNTTAVTAPRSPMCWSVLVESALAAADVPVYDSTLYEGVASFSSADNILRVGRELGLCADDANANALVTRGEAAIILHVVLTQSFHVEEPPAPVTFGNRSGINANAILMELQYVPRPILDAFNERGWQLVIDCNYIAELGRRSGVGCTGATDYAERTIYVSEAGAVLHEFGHSLTGCWDSPQSMNSSFVQKLPPRRCETMPKPTPENTSQTALPTG